MRNDLDMRHNETCRWCGASLLPGHAGPCPNCGKEGKKIVKVIKEEIQLRDSVSGTLERRREFLEQNPKVKWLLIVIDFGGPFLGLFFGGMPGLVVGLVLAAVSHLLGPLAMIKVIEIERRTFGTNINEERS